MKSAGDYLKEWLIKNEVSQHQFAGLTGLSQAFISKILSKKVFVSVETALLLEKYTALSAYCLLISDVEYRLSLYGK